MGEASAFVLFNLWNPVKEVSDHVAEDADTDEARLVLLQMSQFCIP